MNKETNWCFLLSIYPEDVCAFDTAPRNYPFTQCTCFVTNTHTHRNSDDPTVFEWFLWSKREKRKKTRTNQTGASLSVEETINFFETKWICVCISTISRHPHIGYTIKSWFWLAFSLQITYNPLNTVPHYTNRPHQKYLKMETITIKWTWDSRTTSSSMCHVYKSRDLWCVAVMSLCFAIVSTRVSISNIHCVVATVWFYNHF